MPRWSGSKATGRQSVRQARVSVIPSHSMNFMSRTRARRKTDQHEAIPDRDDMLASHADMDEDEHRRAMRAMARQMMRGKRDAK